MGGNDAGGRVMRLENQMTAREKADSNKWERSGRINVLYKIGPRKTDIATMAID